MDTVGRHTDEDESSDDTPGTRKTVDHQSSLTGETERSCDESATGFIGPEVGTRHTVDSRTKVGTNIDTCPLTHCLNEDTTDGSVQVWPGVDEIHNVGGQVLPLPFDLGEHLVEFSLDNLGVSSSSTVQSDKGGFGLFVSAHLREPSRGEGEHEHSADHDERDVHSSS